MASGHVNRANKPNTWLHRPVCNVKKVLANSEPSTQGPKGRRDRLRMSALESEADLVESLPTFDFEGLILQCDTRCRVATCGQLSILSHACLR
jgi:hypothetical protein